MYRLMTCCQLTHNELKIGSVVYWNMKAIQNVIISTLQNKNLQEGNGIRRSLFQFWVPFIESRPDDIVIAFIHSFRIFQYVLGRSLTQVFIQFLMSLSIGRSGQIYLQVYIPGKRYMRQSQFDRKIRQSAKYLVTLMNGCTV